MGCDQGRPVYQEDPAPAYPAGAHGGWAPPPAQPHLRHPAARGGGGGGLVAGGYVPPPPAAIGAPVGPAIRFTVAALTGRREEYELPCDATVGALKREIERRTGAPAVTLRLVFAGRQLDDAQTLSFYQITKGAAVHMVQRRIKDGHLQRPELQDLLDTYEITLAQADDLKVLAQYDIVFLVDDSGSMNRVETTAGVTQSRWQELRDTVSALIEFAAFFDDDGTDVYFLNREGAEGVTDPKDPKLQAVFAGRPRGRTPLRQRLEEVVAQHPGKKPLLIVLATDGEPDEGVPDFINCVRRILNNPRGRDVRMAVMACTQDDRAVRWLNDLDDDPVVGNKVDVCDDYEAEKEEVMSTGKVQRFLISDYYLKALLGPILSKYDQLDGSGAVAGHARLHKGRGGELRGGVGTASRPAGWGCGEGTDGVDGGSVVGELTRLFLLRKAGALDAAQFAAAKRAVLT